MRADVDSEESSLRCPRRECPQHCRWYCRIYQFHTELRSFSCFCWNFKSLQPTVKCDSLTDTDGNVSLHQCGASTAASFPPLHEPFGGLRGVTLHSGLRLESCLLIDMSPTCFGTPIAKNLLGSFTASYYATTLEGTSHFSAPQNLF